MAYDSNTLISAAQKRLEQAKAADQHNREQAKEDLLFATLQQWDQSLLKSATNETPATPYPVVDRLTAFRNQVINEIRQAKPEPSVAPRGNGANKDTAEVIEGKVRDILYDSDSDLAFIEAAKYAVASSVGSFRLDPEIVDEDTGQQVLRVNPIWDPSTVYTDPFAKRPDKSDARWRIVVIVMSRIEFAERWPDAEATAADFFDKERTSPGWMDPTGDKESVMVAEYWCVEEIDKPNRVALADSAEEYNEDRVWPDGKTYTKDRNDAFKKRQKERGDKKQVVCHLIDGKEELEPPTYRPGKIIPIFDVEGDAYWVEGKRFTTSLTRPARDMQRTYNFLAKKKIEMLGMASSSPYLVTEKQIGSYTNMWQDMNIKNRSYVLFNPDPLNPGPPTRTNAEAPIEALTNAEMVTAQEMKDSIGLQDPNLGRAQGPAQSGLAIQKLRSEGDLATFHYQDNLTRALKTFCKVLVNWIPYYHDIEEEMVILMADMAKKQVQVNTPAPVADPKGRMYQHDLTKGNYEVVVDVGPSYATAREAQATFYSALVAANPAVFNVIGDMLIRAQDSPGANEAADRVKRWIALQMPGLIQDDENALPAGANAQMQALQGQLQQLQGVVQQQGMMLKTQAIPHQIKAQSDAHLAGVKSQTTLLQELIKAKTALAKMAAEERMHGKDHAHAMYDTNLREVTDAIEHVTAMLHESELAPGPDQGPQGIHPSAIPQPAANGAPQAP